MACNLYNVENDNGVYIPNPGVDISKKSARRESSKKILAVARFDDAVKQIDKTLLVFKEIYKLDHEYKLDIVGYCPMNLELSDRGNITLKDFIKRYDIPVGNIRFHGEQKNVSPYYDDASFLVMTSKCEGFGMVFLEALSNGLPCASLDYFGIEELVQNGYNGWVRSQDDYKGLADVVVNTIQNKNLFAEMSQNAIKSVEQFNVMNFYKKWETLLKLTLEDEVNINQDLLKPTSKLTIEDYKKITHEYERLLKSVVEDYLNKEFPEDIEVPKPISKMESLNIRFKESIVRDGMYLTGEKIARKIYSKTIRKKK
jgi:hypothetical protein